MIPCASRPLTSPPSSVQDGRLVRSGVGHFSSSRSSDFSGHGCHALAFVELRRALHSTSQPEPGRTSVEELEAEFHTSMGLCRAGMEPTPRASMTKDHDVTTASVTFPSRSDRTRATPHAPATRCRTRPARRHRRGTARCRERGALRAGVVEEAAGARSVASSRGRATSSTGHRGWAPLGTPTRSAARALPRQSRCFAQRFRGLPVGVSNGVRTRDTWNHNPVLYQLSYTHRAPDGLGRSGSDSILDRRVNAMP